MGCAASSQSYESPIAAGEWGAPPVEEPQSAAKDSVPALPALPSPRSENETYLKVAFPNSYAAGEESPRSIPSSRRSDPDERPNPEISPKQSVLPSMFGKSQAEALTESDPVGPDGASVTKDLFWQNVNKTKSSYPEDKPTEVEPEVAATPEPLEAEPSDPFGINTELSTPRNTEPESYTAAGDYEMAIMARIDDLSRCGSPAVFSRPSSPEVKGAALSAALGNTFAQAGGSSTIAAEESTSTVKEPASPLAQRRPASAEQENPSELPPAPPLEFSVGLPVPAWGQPQMPASTGKPPLHPGDSTGSEVPLPRDVKNGMPVFKEDEISLFGDTPRQGGASDHSEELGDDFLMAPGQMMSADERAWLESMGNGEPGIAEAESGLCEPKPPGEAKLWMSGSPMVERPLTEPAWRGPPMRPQTPQQRGLGNHIPEMVEPATDDLTHRPKGWNTDRPQSVPLIPRHDRSTLSSRNAERANTSSTNQTGRRVKMASAAYIPSATQTIKGRPGSAFMLVNISRENEKEIPQCWSNTSQMEELRQSEARITWLESEIERQSEEISFETMERNVYIEQLKALLNDTMMATQTAVEDRTILQENNDMLEDSQKEIRDRQDLQSTLEGEMEDFNKQRIGLLEMSAKVDAAEADRLQTKHDLKFFSDNLQLLKARSAQLDLTGKETMRMCHERMLSQTGDQVIWKGGWKEIHGYLGAYPDATLQDVLVPGASSLAAERELCNVISSILGLGTSTYITRLIASGRPSQDAPFHMDMEYYTACNECRDLIGQKLVPGIGVVRDFCFERGFPFTSQVLHDDYRVHFLGKLGEDTNTTEAQRALRKPGAFVALPIRMENVTLAVLCVDTCNRHRVMQTVSPEQQGIIEVGAECILRIFRLVVARGGNMYEGRPSSEMPRPLTDYEKDLLQLHGKLMELEDMLRKCNEILQEAGSKRYMFEMQTYKEPPGKLLELWMAIFVLVSAAPACPNWSNALERWPRKCRTCASLSGPAVSQSGGSDSGQSSDIPRS
ncbi:hypothetical protein CYMTET_53011 [Cymbomonas tetramitiformis]|uniref:Uncharacterized protein n=1 Tax=Cymbomonas tetramitiformis TaxID=36881 RepID=A0AAE0BHT0_9CHLO|nr:hypothetical protein CYMTET_53011 [Cymbomonas tetramitiformis]